MMEKMKEFLTETGAREDLAFNFDKLTKALAYFETPLIPRQL